jgi:hypothetical protein
MKRKKMATKPPYNLMKDLGFENSHFFSQLFRCPIVERCLASSSLLWLYKKSILRFFERLRGFSALILVKSSLAKVTNKICAALPKPGNILLHKVGR